MKDKELIYDTITILRERAKSGKPHPEISDRILLLGAANMMQNMIRKLLYYHDETYSSDELKLG